MSKSLEKFQNYCTTNSIPLKIQQFPQGTRTSVDAAKALNTDVSNIVKSLLFLATGEPVLVLMTGDKRVSVEKLAKVLGINVDAVTKADADTTREITGYPVGGIPPFGHNQKLKTVMDESILTKTTCFAACGTPDTIFEIQPKKLEEIVKPIVDTVGE